MKDLSPYNEDLNLYKQESYHCNLQLAPNYWIAILKSMPILLIQVIQILMCGSLYGIPFETQNYM